MKKGFTLVELLAVIIIIGIIAVIVAPAVSNGLKTNSENALKIQKERIVDAAKDWSLEHLSSLPKEDNKSIKVKLSELKKGYIDLNIKNPKTGAILSDETYVKITNNSGDYSYDVVVHDIDGSFCSNDFVFLPETTGEETINIGSLVDNYNVTVTVGGNSLEPSKQYILNNNEVSKIDTSTSGTYSIVYTVLYEGNICKRVKTVIVK